MAMEAQAWQAIGGPDVPLDVTGEPPRAQLPSALPVADAALACVGAALRAAAALCGQRASLDTGRLPAVVRSERHLRIDGRQPGSGFAPLSRFWPVADGWVRTHANYPWHEAALRRALGAADDEGADRIGSVLAGMAAADAEDRIIAAGGVAAAMRTPARWLAHPQGRAVSEQPLVGLVRHDTGSPRATSAGPAPLSGVRVLDLTRVIAGPVATRFLGALGADVLRLDPPDRPELLLHRYDGLPGKRSALLDAGNPAGRARLHELLERADVVVHGYRPGALARFGLDAGALAERHPGLVVVALSAWSTVGPWGGRRGFDSIVQVATGIAARESGDGIPDPASGARPGALPCQLLDHGTGYLCAAAALDGLRRQRTEGGTFLRELSLARTAHWLLDQPATPSAGPDDTGPADASPFLVTVASDAGPVTTVAPPGALDGVPLRFPDLPIGYGRATAEWV